MSRNSLFPRLLVAILLIILGRPGSSYARGSSDGPSQTIPTRTSTPGPTSPPPTIVIPPTSPPGGGDPTETPAPETPTATLTGPTPTATGTFVQAGSLTPTADACSDRPTVQALGVTNVRSGPGAGYPVVDTMFYLQVNLIIGRARDVPWWQIGLDKSGVGWVSDAVLSVQGYTGSVPIVAAPAIGDGTVTPGSPWDPTPRPSCTVTPTSTSGPTATVTPTPTQGLPAVATATEHAATVDALTIADGGGTATAEQATPAPKLEVTQEEPPSMTVEAVVAGTAASGDRSQTAAQTAELNTPPPTPEPILIEEPSRMVDLLPVAGVILLIAGIVISIAGRRRGGDP